MGQAPAPAFVRALRVDREQSIATARDSIRRIAAGVTRAASPFAIGDRVIDTVTGEEGEIIHAERAHYIVPTARG